MFRCVAQCNFLTYDISLLHKQQVSTAVLASISTMDRTPITHCVQRV
jgi:hypothetical protein